jgi:hypothetical protein
MVNYYIVYITLNNKRGVEDETNFRIFNVFMYIF